MALLSPHRGGFASWLGDLVRPVLTISFAFTMIWLTICGKVSAEYLQGLATATVAYWFAEHATAFIPTSLGRREDD